MGVCSSGENLSQLCNPAPDILLKLGAGNSDLRVKEPAVIAKLMTVTVFIAY